jgi:hypothetical protein
MIAASESRLSRIALSGSTIERNVRARNRKLASAISSSMSGKAPYTAATKSMLSAAQPPTQAPAGTAARIPVTGVLTGGGPALVRRQHGDQCGAVPAPVRSVRRDGREHPRQAGELAGHPLPAGSSTSTGVSTPLGMPLSRSWTRPSCAGSRRGERVGLRFAEPQAERRSGQQEQRRGRHRHRGPAGPDHPPRPAGPAPAWPTSSLRPARVDCDPADPTGWTSACSWPPTASCRRP